MQPDLPLRSLEQSRRSREVAIRFLRSSERVADDGAGAVVGAGAAEDTLAVAH